jgi:hypothetical protein
MFARWKRQLARMQADVDAMRAETQNHAALLEQRQAFLASVISGQADASQLRALLPDEATQPRNAAARTASEPYAEIDGLQNALADQASRRNRAALSRDRPGDSSLGVNPARFHRSPGAVGGPFEAVDSDNADPRFRELFVSWRRLDQLEQA